MTVQEIITIIDRDHGGRIKGEGLFDRFGGTATFKGVEISVEDHDAVLDHFGLSYLESLTQA